jgi:hypothetical protein
MDERYKDVLIIHANKSAIVEIPFTCNPQPSVNWTFNGKRLPDPRRTTEETIYNMTALTISRARRSDSGTYSLCLENPSGKATVDIKVKVLGVYSSRSFPFISEFLFSKFLFSKL